MNICLMLCSNHAKDPLDFGGFFTKATQLWTPFCVTCYAREAGILFSIEALASGNARFQFVIVKLSLKWLDVDQTWLR